MSLTHSPLWVRIKNLPFNCRPDEYLRVIATSLEKWLDIETDELGLENYRRVKVISDVTKSL